MKYTLENIVVENPCPIDWDTMRGNDEVRHCNSCQHKVFNISEMPKRRALKVLNQTETSICITYHRDEQNRVVTQSYPGIFKRNFVKTIGAVLTMIFSFTSIHALQTKPSKPKKKVAKHRKYKKQTKPPGRVVGPPGTSKKKIIGLLQ